MIGRLRASAARPLGDRDRQRAFTAAAAALVAAAVALSAVAAPPESPAPTDRVDRARAGDRDSGSPPPPLAAPGAGRPAAVPPRVVAVARRFLSGYLARLYGHTDPPPLDSATARLRRRLNLPARVSPALRHRRPQIAEVDAQRLSGGRWLVAATVADGDVASYPVAVVVADRLAGPAVTRVVED